MQANNKVLLSSLMLCLSLCGGEIAWGYDRITKIVTTCPSSDEVKKACQAQTTDTIFTFKCGDDSEEWACYPSYNSVALVSESHSSTQVQKPTTMKFTRKGCTGDTSVQLRVDYAIEKQSYRTYYRSFGPSGSGRDVIRTSRHEGEVSELEIITSAQDGTEISREVYKSAELTQMRIESTSFANEVDGRSYIVNATDKVWVQGREVVNWLTDFHPGNVTSGQIGSTSCEKRPR